MIEFLTGGLLTTVQDKGRYGMQRYGVAVSGAMDHYAHSLANILVGNQRAEASFEVTMLGPDVKFHTAVVFAVCGAQFSHMQLNGQPIECGRAYSAKAGDVLKVGYAEKGVRAYLAVAGGLAVPQIHDSSATYLRGKIGGWDGRAIKAGDMIPMKHPVSILTRMSERKVVLDQFYQYDQVRKIRVLMGPQDNYFSEAGKKTFFSSEYTITPENDRMGYRMDGPEIEYADGYDGNIVSDGIPKGAIQIPSGKPIIMMADRQTTGGYAKIASVINVDLAQVAQMRTGEKLTFEEVSIDEAHEWMLKRREELHAFEEKLNGDGAGKISKIRVHLDGEVFDITVETVEE